MGGGEDPKSSCGSGAVAVVDDSCPFEGCLTGNALGLQMAPRLSHLAPMITSGSSVDWSPLVFGEAERNLLLVCSLFTVRSAIAAFAR